MLVVALVLGSTWTIATWAVGPPSAGAVGCPAASGDQLSVVIVVDRGSGAPSQRCVVVDARATGLDVLRSAHSARIELGGFVCAVDGLPATGCAVDDASLPYWRYWYRDGSRWVYSSVGAFRRLTPPADGSRCLVEGWSYGISTSGSPANAPRVAPGPVTCDRPAPPTAPTPTAPAPTAPAASPAPGAGAPGSRAQPSTGGGSDQATTGTDEGPGGALEDPQTSPPSAAPDPGGAVGGKDAEGGTPTGHSPPDAQDDPEGDLRGEVEPEDDVAASGASALVASDTTAGSGSGERPWLGSAVALLLVAALGGAAWRARSRNA